MQLFETISSFFISNAYADTAAASSQPQQGGFSFFIMMAVLLFFMYFVIWRPQSRRAKEQRNLLTSLAKGDEVITAGGMLGTINKITDTYVVLTLADNVEITMQKSSIVAALPKGTIRSI